MARTTWQIATLESGDVYTDSFTIYRPNNDLDFSRISTAAKVTLADGTFAFATPEQAFNSEDITMEWQEVSDTDDFIANIKASITAKETIRITTNNANQIFYGKFVRISEKWLIGRDGDIYVVTAIFSFLST